MKKGMVIVLALLLGIAPGVFAEPLLKDGDRLAILGDSITEARIYGIYINAYLTACSGLRDTRVMLLSKNGETATSYTWRMEANQAFYAPTVATVLYGMNDAGYQKYKEELGEKYKEHLNKIAVFMHENNVKLLIGSPPTVDTESFQRGKFTGADYNETLAAFGDIGAAVAKKNSATFVDVHHIMRKAMADAKAKFGEKYLLSNDGVHPHHNGQMVIAYAFLKAMGFDGAIGTIEMDYASGEGKATAGHKVLKAETGKIELESTRYPFCFNAGDHYSRNAALLPFIPFNQELNRFILKVNAIPTAKATVHFGQFKRSFTREDLASGINLAVEFLNDNPFRGQFIQLDKLIWERMDFESWASKSVAFELGQRIPGVQGSAAQKEIIQLARQRWEALSAGVAAAVKPIRYQITVTPER